MVEFSYNPIDGAGVEILLAMPQLRHVGLGNTALQDDDVGWMLQSGARWESLSIASLHRWQNFDLLRTVRLPYLHTLTMQQTADVAFLQAFLRFLEGDLPPSLCTVHLDGVTADAVPRLRHIVDKIPQPISVHIRDANVVLANKRGKGKR